MTHYCLENATYPPYHAGVHYVFVALMAAFIPVIICGSVLVIASVTLVKQLHNAHNQLLRSIAVMDLLIALIVIPVFLVSQIPRSRHIIHCHKHVMMLFQHIALFIQLTSVSFLSLLTVDSFIQINFPLFYKKHKKDKWMEICCLVIALAHLTIIMGFYGKNFHTFESEFKYCKGIIIKISERKFTLYYLSVLSLCLFVGICCAIQIRVIICKHTEKHVHKIVSWLLMAFLILYMPTVLLVIYVNMSDCHDINVPFITTINRFLRLLIPLSNSFLIYFSRPIYRHTFRYLLKTNPMKWKKLQRSLNTRILQEPSYTTRVRDVYRSAVMKVLLKKPGDVETVTGTSVETTVNEETVELVRLALMGGTSRRISDDESSYSQSSYSKYVLAVIGSSVDPSPNPSNFNVSLNVSKHVSKRPSRTSVDMNSKMEN